MKTIAIVSGGMDSAVLAYFLKERGDRLYLLSFDYGQRHSKELNFARAMAVRLGVQHRIVDLTTISDMLRSVLTEQGSDIPEGHYAAESMAATVVPNRNAIMLAIAYGWAVSIEADRVATGVHAGDHFIYPDCRPEFILAFDLMETLATHGYAKKGLKLEAPFVEATKADIVGLGYNMKVPFEQTWSCYAGGEVHCSVCGTCVERRLAFREALVSDPTKYVLTEDQFDSWLKEQGIA
jgi:7-cyano-7-deazaguanine synthase